ncbi:MAG: hypothetical protein IT336_14225 [Thermomicrobiales bacterium]|nr:hypothetical protein [Thermomicrobiales bacterium]
MGHRPPILRLLAAFILALGLLGSIVTPSLAQDDGTPVAEEPVTEEVTQTETDEPVDETEPAAEEEQVEEIVEPTAEGLGTLLLLYYLCDGGAGFEFTVGLPSEGNPNPIVEDCAIASAADGTDRTFYVYPFGDTTATPLELTTVDGVIMDETLPVTDGTPHKITNKPIEQPEAVEEVEEAAEEEEPPVEADFEIVEETITGINASQFQTGSVEIHKFRCQGDPDESLFNVLNPGETFDPAPYEGCAADDRSFTITPFDDEETFGTIPVTTVDGLATIDEIASTSLASGPHKIAEDGTELVGVFDVEPNTNTVVIAVNYEEAVGSLVLTKFTCTGDSDTQWFVNELAENQEEIETECALADESFSIYLFGDMESDPITTNTGETGTVEVDALPATGDGETHVIVEDATGSETTFEVIQDLPTIVTVINYEPEVADEGTLELETLACSGIAVTQILVGNPGDDAANIPGNCTGDFARFIIYPFGDQSAEPIQIDVTEFESIDLPATNGTPHLIIEVDGAGVPVADATFEIEGDNFTPIQVRNPTYGSITIYSFMCEGTPNSTFDVYDPGQSVTLPADCDFLERDFTITLFGSGTSRTVSTGGDGIVGLSGIPATNNIPHTISKSSGVSASFDVDRGRDTVIVSISWQEDGGVIDDDDDSENVDEVADTGVGPMMPAGGNSALLFGLLSLATLVGAAAATRKRAA